MGRGIWRRSSGVVTLITLELVCFLLVSYQIQVEPHLTLLERMTLTLAAPFQDASDNLSSFVDDRVARSKSLERLERENTQMAMRLEHMERVETQLREATIENQRLRALLKLPLDEGWQTVSAEVVGRVSRGDDGFFLINRGSLQGVQRDMGVIAPAGLIGVVWEVSPFYSKVMSAGNPATAIACMIQESRYRDSYLVGQGGNSAKLENVPNFADVKAGDRVVTSGLDGLFPKGRLVGTVVQSKATSHMFLDIDVRLSANFNSLEEVLVLIPTVPAEAP